MQQKTTKNSYLLNGYIIGKTIGRGTFGKVKMAIHKLTGQPVAIKFLQKQKIKDTSDVQRVSRQLHFLKIARHSAIAQLYEIIQTPKMIYIIMEYAIGGQYFDYVMEQKIKDQAQAFHYFSQILSALIYLHKLRISHRDVKPQNMLLDSKKRIKLVDFGLSNMYKIGQKLSTACGSPCYASPQMIKGQDYDPQLTDVWSLGIVLYTSVMAKLPFEDDSTNALYSKIKSGLYIIERKISPQLKDLLSKLINVKPQNRMRLKQILYHPWYKRFSTQKQISGIQIGYQNIPIDKSIVEQMVVLGFQARKTMKYLQNNIKNQCTTTYYLMLKRNFKLGKASSMDICSQNFQKSIISPFFSIKPKRFKSLDMGKLLQNQQSPHKQTIVQRKCSSQLKYQTQGQNQRKIHKSFSLRKQSIDSINSGGSNKLVEGSKMQRFLRLKAGIQVKQRLFRKTLAKNKSLSISTQKVRKSSKKLDEYKNNNNTSSIKKISLNIQSLNKNTNSIKNIKVNISHHSNNNDGKRYVNMRLKTDFIQSVYCPKKSVNKYENQYQKQRQKVNRLGQKVNRTEHNLDIDIGNIFWRKKSSTLKKVNQFTRDNCSRPIRGNRCNNND